MFRFCRRKHRVAFTIIEALIVISIIAILIAILIPAVQATREAARQAQCRNNLKQLGVALHLYHSANGRFPCSILYDEQSYPDLTLNIRPNWVVLALPFIEEQAVFDRFNFAQPMQHPVNAEARGVPLSFMICPSDLGHESLFGDDFFQYKWGRGNYGANACLGAVYYYHPTDMMPNPPYTLPCGGPNMPFWKHKLTRGIMGANVSLRIKEITDGTSNTLLLGELRVGLTEVDRRGTWALGLPGASSLWGHAIGLSSGPNAISGDHIGACEQITSIVGAETLQLEGMSCGPFGDPSTNRASPRSRHPGGMYACMADGSVRFVSNEIESGDFTPDVGSFESSQMLAWQRLNASGDGLPIDSTVLQQ